MKKSVKVNYPKKKPRLKLEDLGDVAEPERTSMYQLLLNSLKIAERTTFLHRIIYVGVHKFTSYTHALELFSGIISKCNESYCLEKLSGFMLYYPQYIVHMVEGDEDNINKHLKYLLDKSADHYKYLGTFKLLINLSNIHRRFFDNWLHYTGTPSKLLEKLDINSDLQASGRIIYNCIKKFYTLVGNFAEDESSPSDTLQVKKGNDSIVGQSSLEIPVSSSASGLFTSLSHSSNRASFDRAEGSIREYRLFLPEYELLDFVINSNFTMKLQEYSDLYGVVPMRDIYKDRVWPVPDDFIPYDVFEKPYDCLIELPKELRRRPLGTGVASVTQSLASVHIGADSKSTDTEAPDVKESTTTIS